MAPSKSEYEVERIVSDKYLVGRRFFFVKWQGFNSQHNTWEPEENLANCPRMVREYFASKGLRDSKSQNISSTLMRSLKVSEPRRSSILALTSPKASPRGSRRSSVDSQAAKAKDLQPAETKNLQLAKIDELQPAEASDLQAAETMNQQPAEVKNLQSPETNDLKPTKANLAEANLSNTSPSGPAIEPPVATLTPPAEPPVDQNVDSANMIQLREKKLNESPEGGELLSTMGLNFMLPKIELVKVDDDISEFERKKAELMRLGLVLAKNSPRSSVGRKAKGRVGKRAGRPPSYTKCRPDLPRISRSSRAKKSRFSLVDLTADSTSADETGFSSSQLMSDNDRSWQNSTTVDCKFPNKLQVRLFDQTPRPEVLISVPFLENFESDPEPTPEWVTEDSDKENMTRKRRGRTYKRSRGRPRKVNTSDCDSAAKVSKTRKSEMLAPAEVAARDLPKTDDAMVLLTEQNQVRGSNFVMYFPRLQLIKSIPEKMADKYYSQAVIDYYRRSMQPPVRVARRSF